MTTVRDRLYIAGGAQRLVKPQLDGSPLLGEVDYDELNILNHWREYERLEPDQTRYLMYELSQRDVGQERPIRYYKAVRLIRVTRVPRYLRQAGRDNNSLFDQQRDVLAALYQENVLFLTMVAKAPDLPLIFSYGVQATGATPEEAKAMADRSYAVLAGQLDGTYQQLEYQPLTVNEAERLVRYQNEWNYLAMARGRPKPTGGSSSLGGVLDGNRTDVEQTANQLESFIRGMGESSFMLSLITVPVPPLEITRAWRNLAHTLSDIRSDTDGVRGINAGIALPLGFGLGHGDSAGQSHSAGDSLGRGLTDTEGTSYTAGVSEGSSVADTVGASAGETLATSHGVTDSIAVTQGVTDSVSLAHGQTHGEALSHSTSFSEGLTRGESLAHGQSVSEQFGQSEALSATATQSQSLSEGHSASVSQTQSVSSGESAQVGSSEGVNWSSGANRSLSAGQTLTDGLSSSRAESLSQALGITDTSGDSFGQTQHNSFNFSAGAGFAGLSENRGGSDVRNVSDSDSLSSTLTGGATNTIGTSRSLASQLSESLGVSESLGGSRGTSLSQGVSVGSSQGVTAGEGVSSTATAGVSQSQGYTQGQSRAVGFGESLTLGQSLATSQQVAQSAGMSQSVANSTQVGQAQAVSQATSSGQSVSASQSQAFSRTESVSHTEGASRSVSEAVGVSSARAQSVSRGVSDAYMTSMGRTAQTSGSLGLVPTIGAHISRQTRDEAKRILGDMLEAQVKRYVEGIESGAFLYQMSLVAGDPETLARAAGLLKSAFWGPGENGARLPHPFHVIDSFDPGEGDRILEHVRAFSSYRRREPNIDNIEPFLYSSYLTPGEGAAFSHPPTAEAPGIMAMQDSMPVFAMPSDRGQREIHLGHIVNGERAKISPVQFGLDADELTHVLVAGVTGSGKTTTVLRLLSEVVRSKRKITYRRDPKNPRSEILTREVPAGALCLDWQKNMRNLASVVEPERFRFFSLAKPALGQFRWNLLAVPSEDISPVEWANTISDLFMISYGLGEFARSIIWEHINDLYSANRLEPLVLREAVTDATGTIIRPGIALPPVDPATLPAEAIQTAPDGSSYANVYTHPALSRLIGVQELAISVMARIESLSSQEAGRMHGTEIRNRYQTVWRRLQYFAPGGPLAQIFGSDPDLGSNHCLTVEDIVDPERGLVTVIEADGLDLGNRKLVLGGIFMSVWRYGQAIGEGAFNNGGKGAGTFVCLEEAHELFGSQGDGEDRDTAATRTALWESIYRRSRQVGLRLIACVQNPGDIPAAIYSNSSTALIHRLYDEKDRKVVKSLMNWNTTFDHRREERYLGEMPVGWCLARLDSKNHYLEAAPIHFVTDPANLAEVSDLELLELAAAGAY